MTDGGFMTNAITPTIIKTIQKAVLPAGTGVLLPAFLSGVSSQYGQ